MAVKASVAITISSYRDTQSVTRYYKLQASTASAPSKPTANPPSGWTTTEPSYSEGSTNTLYFCDLTVFSNGEWEYSAVSKSSSYEAAKAAYNKAVNANNTANTANEKITNQLNYFWSDDEGVHIAADPSGAGNNVLIDASNIYIRHGTTVLAKFNNDEIDLGIQSANTIIDFCNGSLKLNGFIDEGDIKGASMTVPGDFSLTTSGWATINSSSGITIDAPTVEIPALNPTAVTVTKVAGDTYLTMNAYNIKKMYKLVSGYVYLTTNAAISAGNNLLQFPEGSRPASTQYLPLFNISEGKLTYATIDSNGYFKNGGALTSGKVYIANPNYFTA